MKLAFRVQGDYVAVSFASLYVTILHTRKLRRILARGALRARKSGT
jgi:hypothetical protein